MRAAEVLAPLFGGVVALTVLTGCGPSTDGNPTATTPKSRDDIQVFNPCTQLSDDVLRATGVDPTTRDVTTDPPSGPAAWRICAWKSTSLPYHVGVASSSHTVDETRANGKETGFRNVMIGPRKGLIHVDKIDTRGDVCRVAIPAQQGMFVISAEWSAIKPITQDRCELAVKHAKDLEPHLPK